MGFSVLSTLSSALLENQLGFLRFPLKTTDSCSGLTLSGLRAPRGLQSEPGGPNELPEHLKGVWEPRGVPKVVFKEVKEVKCIVLH